LVIILELGGEWLDSFESNSLEISTAAMAELASAGYWRPDKMVEKKDEDVMPSRSGL